MLAKEPLPVTAQQQRKQVVCVALNPNFMFLYIDVAESSYGDYHTIIHLAMFGHRVSSGLGCLLEVYCQLTI